MENWVERKTPQGRPYFCNLVTQETTWDYDEIDSETGHLVNIKHLYQQWGKKMAYPFSFFFPTPFCVILEKDARR